MNFIKNENMKNPKELNETVNEALKHNIKVSLLINGEYYDIKKSFKRGC